MIDVKTQISKTPYIYNNLLKFRYTWLMRWIDG